MACATLIRVSDLHMRRRDLHMPFAALSEIACEQYSRSLEPVVVNTLHQSNAPASVVVRRDANTTETAALIDRC